MPQRSTTGGERGMSVPEMLELWHARNFCMRAGYGDEKTDQMLAWRLPVVRQALAEAALSQSCAEASAPSEIAPSAPQQPLKVPGGIGLVAVTPEVAL
jgi:hypothetical protein